MTELSRAPYRIDLHTHSTASDGTSSPAELVEMASRRGLHTLALTDHDSTEGLDAALRAAARVGLTLIPGVELSTDVAAGELHMLGYFIDHSRDALREALRRLREGRARRAERIVRQLQRTGIAIDLAEVEHLAAGGAIGRAHVARILVAGGHAASVDDAFQRYLVPGRPGYVPRPRLSPTEAVALIHAAGGAAVLAHPYSVSNLLSELQSLAAVGLDGLEAYYGAYSPLQQGELAALAAELRLVVTGGSDFHGVGEREGSDLGSAPVPAETVGRLAAAAAKWER